MRRNVIPAGENHAVVVGRDPDEPICIEDVSGAPYPYSQTLARLSVDAAEGLGRALLEAVARCCPPAG